MEFQSIQLAGRAHQRQMMWLALIEDVKAHDSITRVRNGRVAWLCVQEVAGRSDDERVVEGVRSHGLACVVALSASVI